MKLRLTKILLNTAKTLMLPAAVYIIFFILSRTISGTQFGTWTSINIILQQSVFNALVGWSMSYNMVNGRWDFSVGAQVLIVAIIGTSIALLLGWGAFGILLCCVIVGVGFGTLSGAVQLAIGAPSLVTSFGLLMVYEALQGIINNAQGVRIMGSTLTKFGMSPYVFILGAVVAIIHFVIYEHTKFGYNVRSLAYNRQVAINIGVNDKRNAFGCYVLCGMFAGAAAVVYVSFKGSVQLSMNMASATIVFESMIPVFIGIFLSRYSNLTIGIYIGALSVKMMVAGLIAIGLTSTLQSVANGVFLFLFIAYSVNEKRVREWYAVRKSLKAVNRLQLEKMN
jgi:ribose/xylose/arabinose/galactoside ABC-type transport system permease subunit